MIQEEELNVEMKKRVFSALLVLCLAFSLVGTAVAETAEPETSSTVSSGQISETDTGEPASDPENQEQTTEGEADPEQAAGDTAGTAQQGASGASSGEETDDTDIPEDTASQPVQASGNDTTDTDSVRSRQYEQSLDNGIQVTANAEQGVLPEGATLHVTWLDADDSVAEQLEQAGVEYGGFQAVDLSFQVGEQEVEPDGAVQVQISLPAGVLAPAADSNTLGLLHLTEQEGQVSVETVEAEFSTQSQEDASSPAVTVTFAADGFSVYVLTYQPSQTNDIMPLNVSDNVLENNTVPTVSPSGITIDLFNYSVSANGSTSGDGGAQASSATGINSACNYFRFGANGWCVNWGDDHKNINDSINAWTGSKTPCTGIVENQLVGGYPMLAAGNQYSDTSNTTQRTSLAYLFDASEQTGKDAYFDVTGLLQISENGSYYYDSSRNFASFDKTTKSFTVYNSWAVYSGGAAGSNATGQFFPFADAGTVFNSSYGQLTADSSVKSTADSLDHYFGLHMKAYFMQPTGGQVSNGSDMTFSFSGDDDVWVFIDGVLVGDLGGIHDKATLEINFATGEILVNGEAQKKTLGDILETGDKTLTDGSYHTLDFFYLERGAVDSNMKLETNLASIPESEIIKVDQNGQAVAGATFDLYAANQDYNVIGDPIAQGTTDQNGNLVLLDSDGSPMNFGQRYAEDANTGTWYVLRETAAPAGFRAVDDMHLEYTVLSGVASGQGVLLSRNAWDTGAWAAAKEQITLQNEEGLIDTEGKQINMNGGTLYAVILKKGSDGNWYGVYGDSLSGWNLTEQAVTTGNVLAQLQNQQNGMYDFALGGDGKYSVTIDALPGRVQQYMYAMDEADRGDAEYHIKVFYVSGNSVREVDTKSGFERQFALTLSITDVENILFVQKLDQDGNVIPASTASATFALYAADSVQMGDGVAYLKDDAEPLKTASTADYGSTQNDYDTLALNGLAIFRDLAEGEYYLAEQTAPTGYYKNESLVHIIVDSDGVHADAGTQDDGISTVSGVGTLVDSMAQFASDVDNTLKDITAVKLTGTLTGGQLEWTGGGSTHALTYHGKGSLLEYGPDVAGEVDISDVGFISQTGWTDVQVTQRDGTQAGKTDLTDQDLSNLFTGTTIVRVQDEQCANLTLEKQLEGLESSTSLENQSFTFTLQAVNTTDENQNVTNDLVSKVLRYGSAPQGETVTAGCYYLLDADGTADEPAQYIQFNTSGSATVTISDFDALQKGSVTIVGLPCGQYTLTEQTDSLGEIGGFRFEQVAYQVDGTDQQGDSVTFNLEQKQSGTTTVSAVNTYSRQYSLVITKEVSGEMADTTKSFAFTLEIKNQDGTPFTGTLQTSGDATVSGNNGTYTFALSDGQSLTIQNIPASASVEVQETDYSGYTVYTRQYVQGNPPSGSTSTGDDPEAVDGYTKNDTATVTIPSMDQEYQVDFKNYRTAAVPTGLAGSQMLPFVLLTAVAGCGGVALAGVIVLRLRRRHQG